jgi:RNA recognition motif-containing protein
MKNKVFIGNLPWKTTTEDLVALLQDMGYAFRSARVIEDRETGKSRGFAFVEFETPEGAEQAIKNLNEYVMDGRPMLAAEAKERAERPGGGGGGNRAGDDGGGFRGDGRNSRSDAPPDGGGGHDRRGRRGRHDSDSQNDW